MMDMDFLYNVQGFGRSRSRAEDARGGWVCFPSNSKSRGFVIGLRSDIFIHFFISGHQECPRTGKKVFTPCGKFCNNLRLFLSNVEAR